MYQIKTKYRDQNYYWYGDGVYWKLTEHAAKVMSQDEAEKELLHIKSLGGWATTHLEIIKANVINKAAHLRLIGGSR